MRWLADKAEDQSQAWLKRKSDSEEILNSSQDTN